jgi:hypothetical protein
MGLIAQIDGIERDLYAVPSLGDLGVSPGTVEAATLLERKLIRELSLRSWKKLSQTL